MYVHEHICILNFITLHIYTNHWTYVKFWGIKRATVTYHFIFLSISYYIYKYFDIVIIIKFYCDTGYLYHNKPLSVSKWLKTLSSVMLRYSKSKFLSNNWKILQCNILATLKYYSFDAWKILHWPEK